MRAFSGFNRSAIDPLIVGPALEATEIFGLFTRNASRARL
jgi:hypothetical protein